MSHRQPFQVTGFHSCDKSIGIKVLNGEANLISSDNSWDWLAMGIYFWEQNPDRALQYAIESAQGTQFNRKPIKSPFVLGAAIELGNCLNLADPYSIEILQQAYHEMEKLYRIAGQKMPENKGNNRALDCAVIKFVHQTRKVKKKKPYDTVRSFFPEGKEVYPGASFSSRGHIQVCVLNDKVITGYFLPRPIKKYNPYLFKSATR